VSHWRDRLTGPDSFVCRGWRDECRADTRWTIEWAYKGATSFPSRYSLCDTCLCDAERWLDELRRNHGRDAIVGQVARFLGP
jgi:hypothetical protein